MCETGERDREKGWLGYKQGPDTPEKEEEVGVSQQYSKGNIFIAAVGRHCCHHPSCFCPVAERGKSPQPVGQPRSAVIELSLMPPPEERSLLKPPVGYQGSTLKEEEEEQKEDIHPRPSNPQSSLFLLTIGLWISKGPNYSITWPP